MHRPLAILCLILLAVADSAALCSTARAENPQTQTATLAIEFSADKKQEFAALPWGAELTVADLMRLASEKDKSIQFQTRGSGPTAFLSQINEVKNEGGGGRNWMFYVNGVVGKRSFAVTELQPGDKVTWKFEVFQP